MQTRIFIIKITKKQRCSRQIYISCVTKGDKKDWWHRSHIAIASLVFSSIFVRNFHITIKETHLFYFLCFSLKKAHSVYGSFWFRTTDDDDDDCGVEVIQQMAGDFFHRAKHSDKTHIRHMRGSNLLTTPSS